MELRLPARAIPAPRAADDRRLVVPLIAVDLQLPVREEEDGADVPSARTAELGLERAEHLAPLTGLDERALDDEVGRAVAARPTINAYAALTERR
jgi:hypothetical protein